MNQVVPDASVVLKWVREVGERHAVGARSLRIAYEAGELLVLAPPLLRLELVTVAGRRWGFGEAALVELVESLDGLGFEFLEPELLRVARWTARGLTAYDSASVAVAEAASARLVTDDALILSLAPEIAEPLAGCGEAPSA